MQKRWSAADRAKRYASILAGSNSLPVFRVDSKRSRYEWVGDLRFEDLHESARQVIAVDTICSPRVQLKLPGHDQFVVPQEWITAARSEQAICPKCVGRRLDVRARCDHGAK